MRQEKEDWQRQSSTCEEKLQVELGKANAKYMRLILQRGTTTQGMQDRRVEELELELSLAYKQKRFKVECKDQIVKIEKLRRLVWEMDRKSSPTYSLIQAYEN